MRSDTPANPIEGAMDWTLDNLSTSQFFVLTCLLALFGLGVAEVVIRTGQWFGIIVLSLQIVSAAILGMSILGLVLCAIIHLSIRLVDESSPAGVWALYFLLLFWWAALMIIAHLTAGFEAAREYGGEWTYRAISVAEVLPEVMTYIVLATSVLLALYVVLEPGYLVPTEADREASAEETNERERPSDADTAEEHP